MHLLNDQIKGQVIQMKKAKNIENISLGNATHYNDSYQHKKCEISNKQT